MLVILKSLTIMLLSSTNTQSFVHRAAQLIKDKSNDLQKSLRYLSEIVTSMFIVGTGGCAGQSVSPSFPGSLGLASAFPVIFVLHLIHYTLTDYTLLLYMHGLTEALLLKTTLF